MQNKATRVLKQGRLNVEIEETIELRVLDCNEQQSKLTKFKHTRLQWKLST